MAKKIFTVAILGCGTRGTNVYGNIIKCYPEYYRIVAMCDIDYNRMERYHESFGVTKENCFSSEEEFFEEKRADVLIIATQDRDHVRQCIKALSLGYDILLEKPITSERDECEKILEAEKKYGGKVLVCHVLRYAPAFTKAAELIDSGKIGRLVAINATEGVSYWHQAHSFVRGNWRRSDETSPMIIAKCCHDLDLLQYYAGSKCKSISSVGSLTYFTPENAPEGASKRCTECKYIDSCPYSAKRIYIDKLENGKYNWPSQIITPVRPLNDEALYAAIKEGPYGRCVFACDNNVVDHELTTMTFENGVKATLTMTAFTSRCGRSMTFFGTLGEIELSENDDFIKLRRFGEKEISWSLSSLGAEGGHGGGDNMLIKTMYDILLGNADNRTSLESSIESHLMGICAEESRLAGGKLVYIHSPTFLVRKVGKRT
ncbi:MAG: Gfo/Idh/MocA family protein [Eubacteriales bacterium]